MRVVLIEYNNDRGSLIVGVDVWVVGGWVDRCTLLTAVLSQASFPGARSTGLLRTNTDL